MTKTKVYLIGTGPGDVELITLKAYRLISQADVILHDHLIPHQLLTIAKSTAEIISVGKFASKHTIPQSEINSLIIEKTKQNKLVVRLKGGDPYLFGRGAEEAQACAKANIDFEVVPGVTSALAVPAYAGIPPTHRDYTSSIAIVTGHRKDEKQIDIPKAGTIIFLMPVANTQNIIASLLKADWPPDTKIAAIENGSRYNQRTITATLKNFVEKTEKENLKTPAIFIVGKVVELHKQLNWFDKKPKILFLGTHPEKYRHLGHIVHRQIIDCLPLDDYTEQRSILKNISTFDWIVFTSVNGVKYFFQQLNAIDKDTRALASIKFAAIGKTTAQKLNEFGIIADLIPANESSAGLLEEFAKLDMKNKKVLLPQSQIASDKLSNGLLNIAASTQPITIYNTVELDPGQIDFDYIDQIIFTSSSTVRAFVKNFSLVPPNIKAYCLGPPTSAQAKKLNINAEIIPD